MPLTVPDMSIASNVEVPDTMKTIGSMLNIQKDRQQLQAGNIANQSNQAILQERNNVRSLFQNPKDMMDDQGNIDFNKAAPAIMSAAPTQGGQIITSLIGAQNQSIQTKKEVNALSADQRAQVGQFAMSLGKDDPATGMAKFDAFIKANPNLSTMGEFAKTHLLAPSVNDPAAWQQATLKIGQSIMSPDSQRAAMTPNGIGVSNGQQSSVVNTNPMAGTVGQVIPGTTQQQLVPPGSQESTITDSQGRIAKVTRSPQGAITGVEPVAGIGNGSAPAPLHNVPANESQSSMDALNTQYQEAQGQALKAPNMHSLNQEIYRLADTDVGTGKLGALVRGASNITGYKMGAGDAENYNTLGKMLAQNNAQLAASMGPHTNAGLAQTNEANGTLEYDKNTLKTIATRNDALVTGTELYAQGLKKAINANGLQGKHDFDAKWGAAFDVDAMALKNAVDNGNKGQTQMIIKKLGGPNSAGAQALFKKLTTIDALAGQ